MWKLLPLCLESEEYIKESLGAVLKTSKIFYNIQVLETDGVSWGSCTFYLPWP